MVPDDAPEHPAGDADGQTENDSSRFDRLPATADGRVVERRPTRAEILSWFEDRFGIDPGVFEAHTFWEHGTGKIWVFQGDAPSPAAVEALGMLAVRTRREHWKPTLEAIQRFGDHATRNCIHLPRAEAARFLAGEDQSIGRDGDWGYLVVTHDLAGDPHRSASGCTSTANSGRWFPRDGGGSFDRVVRNSLPPCCHRPRVSARKSPELQRLAENGYARPYERPEQTNSFSSTPTDGRP
jgi:hypothetical protein